MVIRKARKNYECENEDCLGMISIGELYHDEIENIKGYPYHIRTCKTCSDEKEIENDSLGSPDDY